MECEDYVSADSTCSLLNTKSPVDVRNGECIMLKQKPCKICSIAVFKTGKHGDAKYHFGGFDMFTGKRCEELYMAHQKVACPEVSKTQFLVTDMDSDGYVSLTNEKTLEMREDLRITDDDMKGKIRESLSKGDELIVTVLSVVNIEKVIDCKSK